MCSLLNFPLNLLIDLNSWNEWKEAKHEVEEVEHQPQLKVLFMFVLQINLSSITVMKLSMNSV